jgi:3',5'-cyclic AMP phosphodiesterase CpdA
MLLAAACEWDMGQFIAHPAVDQRVRESLADSVVAPTLPDSFRFAVISDIHIGEDGTGRIPAFRDSIASRGLGFFCVTGDLTDGGTPDQYALAKAALDSAGLPYLVTIGNHDLYQASGWTSFKTLFGPSCYSVVVGDRLKLIFLDTADGLVGQRQFDWLEDELNDGDATVKIVLSHYSFYDGTTPIVWRFASGPERYKLQYYLDSFGVKAYVGGHLHGWRHTTIDSVEHFINALSPGEMDYGEPGILIFTFANDSLSWEHVTVD